MDSTKILEISEIKTVVEDLRCRGRWKNLIVFRLSCCCGLRAKEIAGLDKADLVLEGQRPCVNVRKEITKGERGRRKPRRVPLWWSQGTLEDIRYWASQIEDGPLVPSTKGQRIGARAVACRWTTAIRCLEPSRVRQLSIHCGRHSFCSHALNGQRSLVEVQRAAGHANVATTSIYLHLIEREDVPDLF